ncbi:unnamed protein product [Bursaphelenchus xylophilus]|uniref:glutathione transferase n=1 Tax=Bursaphelenchus xylophilus TaxID=6326 RepID=A0A1I7RQJ7_BURXY|nr:unnamed protein product [Bursaphelenchus xylophilus]CAG9104699.1 unnamed protein product [Bursaphelenchus xylophilus]
MPTYELLYFDAYGRAEPIRQAFAYAGLTYKDTRISFAEWPTLKTDTTKIPYGQIPVLLIDGKPLTESHTITRYAARLTKLDGTDPLETAFLDQAYEMARTFFDSVATYYKTLIGLAEGDKEKLKAELFLPNAEKQFKALEDLLKPSGFFGTTGPTYVDLYWAQTTEFYNRHAPELYTKYPKFLEHLKRVENLPELKTYFQNRPDAAF